MSLSLTECATFKTPSDAYIAALIQTLNSPDHIVSPRELPINELVNAKFCVTKPSLDPIVTHDDARNKVIADYTRAEHELYASPDCSAARFAAVAKFWGTLANPDGSINSNYGYIVDHNADVGNSAFEAERAGLVDSHLARVAAATPIMVRTGWSWAVHSLAADPSTRQAIIPFLRPSHLWVGNKDVVCTVAAQFLIRPAPDGAPTLHLTTYMRSNDLHRGLVYDAPYFCSLLAKMQRDLEPAVSVAVGTWTHHATSLHIYQRDIAAARRAAGLMAETPR